MQGRSDDQRELLDAESVAGHLLKADSVFAFLAAHRHELFPEEMFADLFPSRRGRPSVPAEVMASVITLQALHGLSDNETVDAVTFDLRWKAACGLPITEGAFHSTTLTYWRRRLADSERPNRIFEAVRAVVAATGVLAGRTRRALDSTVLDDAVATQDTVTQLIAAIRRVRREVSGAAAVVEVHCTAHDYDDPGKPAIAWDDKTARDQLVDGLVGDAHRLLGHLPDHDLGPRAAEAVALLALISGQDVEPVEGSDGTDGQWRIARQVASDRVISTVDPEVATCTSRCTIARTASRPTSPWNPIPESSPTARCATPTEPQIVRPPSQRICSKGKTARSRSWPIRRTDRASSALIWSSAATATWSSPHRCVQRFPVDSPSTTSPSITLMHG